MSVPFDPSLALLPPTRAVSVDVSSADFDCTAAFPSGFATEIHPGTSAPSDLAVVYFGDTVAVTLKNVVQGAPLKGCFKTIKHTGTTVTNIVAKGF